MTPKNFQMNLVFKMFSGDTEYYKYCFYIIYQQRIFFKLKLYWQWFGFAITNMLFFFCNVLIIWKCNLLIEWKSIINVQNTIISSISCFSLKPTYLGGRLTNIKRCTFWWYPKILIPKSSRPKISMTKLLNTWNYRMTKSSNTCNYRTPKSSK